MSHQYFAKMCFQQIPENDKTR